MNCNAVERKLWVEREKAGRGNRSKDQQVEGVVVCGCKGYHRHANRICHDRKSMITVGWRTVDRTWQGELLWVVKRLSVPTPQFVASDIWSIKLQFLLFSVLSSYVRKNNGFDQIFQTNHGSTCKPSCYCDPKRRKPTQVRLLHPKPRSIRNTWLQT